MKITQSTILWIVITTFIVIGFSQEYIAIERGTNWSDSSIETVERNNQSLINITGTLVTTPNLENERLSLVSKTEQSLIGEVYNLTNKNVKQLLKKKAEQNTSIKMILENRQYKSYGNQFEDLKEEFTSYTNVQFKSDAELDTQYVHAKFRVTDQHTMIQTANLTHGWLNQSKEHLFSSTNPQLHKSLTTLFYSDWNKGTAEEGNFKPENMIPNLLICPINCRSWLEKLIAEATTSITIWNQYITDQSIRNILKEQKRNWVDLQLLVSDNDSNTDLLRYFDHDTARQVNKPYMHTKTMLIDNTYLVIGSINFSSNSMDNNRELAIILIDPKLIEQRKSDFNYFWEQG
jgi:phosphatidylserine/phosphatidylglycerophosphate/cardiolipin synthase-like enzyme